MPWLLSPGTGNTRVTETENSFHMCLSVASPSQGRTSLASWTGLIFSDCKLRRSLWRPRSLRGLDEKKKIVVHWERWTSWWKVFSEVLSSSPCPLSQAASQTLFSWCRGRRRQGPGSEMISLRMQPLHYRGASHMDRHWQYTSKRRRQTGRGRGEK